MDAEGETMNFRPLYAEEIEVRVSRVTQGGVDLLLYKDSRCDMRILDETVGAENWQCEFYEQKGTLFCRVGILVTREVDGAPINGVRVVNGTTDWVWKSNAGAPSNMEAQKGEASDALKRACFTWGIGRELYTSPRIFVPASKCVEIRPGKNGGLQCYDRFSVQKIAIEGGRITGIRIVNDTDGGKVAYSWTVTK